MVNTYQYLEKTYYIWGHNNILSPSVEPNAFETIMPLLYNCQIQNSFLVNAGVAMYLGDWLRGLSGVGSIAMKGLFGGEALYQAVFVYGIGQNFAWHFDPKNVMEMVGRVLNIITLLGLIRITP